VSEVANVDDLMREKLREEAVERDIGPAEVVGTRNLNRRSNVVKALRFFVKIFQEGGVFKAKVRRWKVNICEPWHHTKRVLSYGGRN
jgi:hypothetical protein